MMKKLLLQAIAAIFLSGLLATVSAQGTIVDIASADPDTFGTLVTAVVEAELVETLSSAGPFTVFAPTNEAFDRLPEGVLDYLLANKDALTQVLTYHVLSGSVKSSDIDHGDTAETVQGESVKFRKRWYWSWSSWRFSSRLYVDTARVTQTNVEASNGIIHVINEVLIPPTLEVPLDIVDTAIDAGLHTLVAAVQAAELVEILRGDGPFTVFAPTDDAFDNLPGGVLRYLLDNIDQLKTVLLYHVVSGGAVAAANILDGTVTEAVSVEGSTITFAAVDNRTGVEINNGAATVAIANVEASNGIAHVIDSVLIPPTLTLPPNIVETAVSLPGTFSTLVTALTEAGLVDALSGDGPFTVFAPTNDAFTALGEETLNDLLADPTGELKNILQYHVVSDYVTSTEIVEKAPATARTLNRQTLDISVVDGMVKINGDTTVTDADVVALNGVIHIIDQVLLPPDEDDCQWPRWICRLFDLF